MHIPDEVTAESVLIGNLSTGEIYASRAPERLAPIASLTKLFLAHAALNLMPPESEIEIPEKAVREEGNQGDLKIGERFRLVDLTRLMLTSSSNDAAAALGTAVHTAWNNGHPDAQARSAASVLNRLLLDMGLEHTFFQNVTGLDDGDVATNYSSAGDLFSFARHTYPTPIVWELAREPRVIILSTDGATHAVSHTYPMIGTLHNVIGAKTGTTDQAKESLIILLESPVGRPLAIIILGSEFDKRIADAELLLHTNNLAY